MRVYAFVCVGFGVRGCVEFMYACVCVCVCVCVFVKAAFAQVCVRVLVFHARSCS